MYKLSDVLSLNFAMTGNLTSAGDGLIMATRGHTDQDNHKKTIQSINAVKYSVLCNNKRPISQLIL